MILSVMVLNSIVLYFTVLPRMILISSFSGAFFTQDGQQIIYQVQPGQQMPRQMVQVPPPRAPTPVKLPDPKELAAGIKKKEEQRRRK